VTRDIDGDVISSVLQVCCFSVNTGLYAAWRELDEMVSCHVGHDHNNDFWYVRIHPTFRFIKCTAQTMTDRDLIRGVYGGVRLMYGRKSGYGGYGPPPGWLRGARVIEIHENPFKVLTSLSLLLDCARASMADGCVVRECAFIQMVTWIRQEDGTVVPESSQPLHSPGTNQVDPLPPLFQRLQHLFSYLGIIRTDRTPRQ